MTTAQDTLYWREWGNLTKRCQAEGWTVPDRHELHVRALGKPKSHKDFNNPDFDKVLGVFRAYSQSENVNAQVRQERQPRTRLEYAIVNERAAMLAVLLAYERGIEINLPTDLCLHDHAVAEEYIVVLMRNRFATADITQISNQPDPSRTGEKSDLECLRDTLDARITALRQKTPWTWHALKMRAGVKCDCKTFCSGRKAIIVKREEVAA
jgi:hypothetical protein